MSDFALFRCKEDEQQEDTRKNIFKYLYKLLRSRAREPELDELLRTIELYEDVKMYLLEFPYATGQLSLKSGKIASLILRLREGRENITCVWPKRFSLISGIDGCSSEVFTGKVLFKSLLVQIIDEIYTKRNIKVSELDIAIVHGESYEELYSVLNFLSPYVKYLTIITDEKERVEEEVSKIYNDTGLAVRVTNEHHSGLKHADLIINFTHSKESMFNTKINPKALILNYGIINHNKISGKNIIINGIEVALPNSILSKLEKDMLNFYSKTELAEIILSHKACLHGQIIGAAYDFTLLDKLYNEFKKCGFKITGFIGGRNIFKAADIKLYGT